MAQETHHASFDKPDETRQFPLGRLDVVRLSEGATVGRGVFEPGWRWSKNMQPIAGTSDCQAAHTGQCVSGTMRVRMTSGEEFQINAGEAYHIPPGHDAWVEGDKQCVMIDVTGADKYATRH